MKLTVIIMMLTLMQVSAATFGQNVTIKETRMPLEKVFKEIRKQTGYDVFLSSKQVKLSTTINVDFNNIPLERAIQTVLEGLPLSYTLENNTIVIKEKELSFLEELKKVLATIDVSGRIVDNQGSPLAGANLRVKGTSKVTSTNGNGEFELKNIDENAILEITYLGYQSREIKVAKNLGNVTLEMISGSLSEVLVVSTGYQNIPLERATGSFSKVDNATFDRQVSTDVISRLKGIAPSLSFDQRSGTTRLAIRGRSTIFGNDQPLIVLDNFPFEGNLQNINPNDVESITLLKDAAAASIWGVRAGNGVIVITTKKGRFNQPLNISMTSNVTIGEKPDLFYQSAMKSTDFIDVESMLFDKGFYNTTLNNTTNRPPVSPVVEILLQKRSNLITADQAAAQIDALRNYDLRDDYEKYFYQKSINQQYALNLNGGSEKHSFYLSSSFDKNKASQVGNAFDRIVVNGQQTLRPLKNLEISTGIYFNQNITGTNNTLSSIRMGTQSMYPYARLADDNGNPLSVPTGIRQSFVANLPQQGFLNWMYYPIDELNMQDIKNTLNSTRLSAGANYKIIDGLTAAIKYQYERQSAENRFFRSQDTYYVRDLVNRFTTVSGTTLTRNLPLGGILDNSLTSLNAHNGRAQLNYNKNLNKHIIAALGGFEVRQVRTDGNSSRQYGFDPTVGSSSPVNYTTPYTQYPSGSNTIERNESVVGTVDRYRSYYANGSYTYDNRYTASVSGRIDQSNLFGVAANQRSVPLWSTGVKWDVLNEKFAKNFKWFDKLQLRGSFGYNGNLDNTVTAFTTAVLGNAQVTGQPAAEIRTPPNSELRWERSGVFNIGLDFAVKNSRLSGSLEYFHKKGVDMIGDGPIDPTSGLTSFRGNIANISGKGLDIQLTSINIKSKLLWKTDYLFSYALDKITDYKLKFPLNNFYTDNSFSRTRPGYSPVIGRPLFGIYSNPWAGLDPATGAPRGLLNGEASTNYSAISAALALDPANNLVYNGPALAPYFGALRNTFTYGNWEASFNITYRFGYYFKRSTITTSGLYTNYLTNSDYYQRWQKPGDELVTNVPALTYPANPTADNFYLNSEVLVEKGDHIRLQDVNLSYTFDKSTLLKLPVKQLSLFAYANNLGLLWTANKAGRDPDFPTLKPSKSISFGLRTNF